MGGMVRRALFAAVLALVATASVACSKEADDGVLSSGTDGENDGDGDTSGDGDSGGGSGGQRQEFIDAIAFASENDTDEDHLAMSAAAAACYGEAFVETVGVDELAAKVTPEEIRADPDAEASDWGVDVDQDQGVEIFRQSVDCHPPLLGEIGQGISESLNEGNDTPIAVDVDCLAEADPADIEDFMGAGIASDNEDIDPTPEQAASIVDWIGACADLRGAIVGSLASDPTFPEGAAECIGEGIDDDMLRDLMILAITATNDDGPAFEDSVVGLAFTEVVTRCTATAGG
jgi:hypothetical protein